MGDGSGTLRVDVDGDSSADMSIVLRGAPLLTGPDLVLGGGTAAPPAGEHGDRDGRRRDRAGPARGRDGLGLQRRHRQPEIRAPHAGLARRRPDRPVGRAAGRRGPPRQPPLGGGRPRQARRPGASGNRATARARCGSTWTATARPTCRSCCAGRRCWRPATSSSPDRVARPRHGRRRAGQPAAAAPAGAAGSSTVNTAPSRSLATAMLPPIPRSSP